MSRLNVKTGGRAAAGLFALAFAFIGAREGLRTKAYRDSVGIPTICIGETKGVRMGMRLSKDDCVKLFQRRLDADYARKVEQCVPDARREETMKAETYVSFSSLAYNLGTGGFCKSSVAHDWNAGRHRQACNDFLKFVYARGHHFLPGLFNRRKDERALCLKGLER